MRAGELTTLERFDHCCALLDQAAQECETEEIDMRLKFSAKLLKIYKPFNRKRKQKNLFFDYIATSKEIVKKNKNIGQNSSKSNASFNEEEKEGTQWKDELKAFFFGASRPMNTESCLDQLPVKRMFLQASAQKPDNQGQARTLIDPLAEKRARRQKHPSLDSH